MAEYPISDRNKVRRISNRGVYEQATVHSILDEGLVCHVGFVHEGKPVVIPTLYARIGESVYLHGSVASRMLRIGRDGAELSLTVTLLDGLVIARSWFHHSVNYRSVVVFGRAFEVTDPSEKLKALERFVDHVIPGRANDSRWPNESEMRQTMVLRLDLEEVSAKVRTGGAKDDEEDYALDYWAGVLPLSLVPAPPQPDQRLHGATTPAYVTAWKRGS